MVVTSPVWPPPSWPWAITKSRPPSLWAMACLTLPANAPDPSAVRRLVDTLLTGREHIIGRGTQGVDQHLETRILDSDVDELAANFVGPADLFTADVLATPLEIIRGQFGDVVLVHH